jgi:hypothetical protein
MGAQLGGRGNGLVAKMPLELFLDSLTAGGKQAGEPLLKNLRLFHRQWVERQLDAAMGTVAAEVVGRELP